MTSKSSFRFYLVVCLTVYLTGGMLGFELAPPAHAAPREKTLASAQTLYQQGNYQEAFETYQAVLLENDVRTAAETSSISNAVQCLNSIEKLSDVDMFLEQLVKRHGTNWRVLQAVSQQYNSIQHSGYRLNGNFVRGWARGGEVEYLNADDRDRVRALQLLLDAIHVSENSASPVEQAALYEEMANNLIVSETWKLQSKTDLSTLPDYDVGYGNHYRGGVAGAAPVDESGNPIYYSKPTSFDAAQSDGERWRYCLEHTAELNPSAKGRLTMTFAAFLESQFGVKTLAEKSRYMLAADNEQDNSSSVYSLLTLAHNETIAKLATGIKRFSLPAEFDFIQILKSLADSKDSYRVQALEALARIFEDRQQYATAAEYWKQAIAIEGPGHEQYRQKRLDQIVGAWGQFESTRAQSAGTSGTFEYVFRNATNVSFEAHELKVSELLEDVKEYLRSNPKNLNWQKLQIDNIGYSIVRDNETKYVGEKVASWSVPLTPRDGHLARRLTLEAPLKEAGAYLITAKVAGGNTTKAILWLNDTALVSKQLNGEVLYYVADAKTGAPVPDLNLELFGYRQEWQNNTIFGGRTANIYTKTATGASDSEGQYIFKDPEEGNNYQWLTIARGKKGAAESRLAYLGFQHAWTGRYYDAEYNQLKAYGITDRPVYRPNQSVKYKVWLRNTKYDQEGEDPNANSSASLMITDPRGEKVFEKSVTLDRWGGVEGELELKKDAPLGVYSLHLTGVATAATFRVEEYKKPEFEVSVDAPAEPVQLGDSITATVKAKYYFGAPVTKAKLHLKITRSDTTTSWYPVGLWDWFYGSGYWWFAYDYEWYPGWRLWGCRAPIPWFWSMQQNPPELVQDQEVAIGADGTYKIAINTAVAKELHGDTDHRYQVTAEVVDDSRRVITGTGSVLVTRQPFKVYAWVDRGHYRSGDVVNASFSAQTGDNKPVQGKGALQLLALSYTKDGVPVEEVVQTWALDTNERGVSELSLKAAKPGQYRLSYAVTDKAQHKIEGGYLFTVAGTQFLSKDYRFNDIELVPDKREYAPGEKVQLQINTEQEDSTVLFFTRPANSVYLKPEVLRLAGKSVTKSIEITKKDMPNFFVEAITVRDGKVFSQVREIIVPPEKRVLNVEVLPSAERYKPGQEATVKLKITDFDGKPYSGSAVVAIYDKSVEYISGGSNVAEIKQFFWKWRRSHRTALVTNLMKMFQVLVPTNQIAMSAIGAFGNAELESDLEGEAEGGASPKKAQVAAQGFSRQKSLLAGAVIDRMAPAPESAPMEAGALSDSVGEAQNKVGDDASGPTPSQGNDIQPTIRSEFADTALWNGDLSIGADGIASVSLKMPENLTTWKIRTWAIGDGTRVGEGTTEVITSKNLLVRLQAPRFFVEKDEVVLSANIHNYLSTKKSVTAKIELPGSHLKLLDTVSRVVEIEPNGEQRVDWRVKVEKEGEAVIRISGLTDEESDAMEMKFPVYVHGMLKTDSYSGVIRPEGSSGTIAITVPSERHPDQSQLEVRYSPTLAGAMVDALPYLVNFPYGCTEQTLNRFLPTVLTQHVLKSMNLDLKEIQTKRANLNAQEIGDDVERAKQWKRYVENPVFDEATVQQMTQAGIDRLAAMQLSGGGWGWFSGYGETPSPHLTAGVVHGLQAAREVGASVPGNLISSGVSYLRSYEAMQLQMLKNAATQTAPYKTQADELDVLVQMVLVDEKTGEAAMRDFVYRDRTKMSVYAKAMQALIFHGLGDAEKTAMLRQNIEQFLVQDEENQTAYLNLGNDGYWWFWYGSEYEAQAYYLKLLTKVDPKGSVAPRLVKYLLNNRKHGTYWNSTRDTAIVVEAFADYLKATDELAPDMTIEVLLDGTSKKQVKVTRENLFSFDNKFLLEGTNVTSGKHTVEIRRVGKGPVYYNAYLTNFTLEDPIAKAGLEVKVQRRYYKLVRDEAATSLSRGGRGQALTQAVEKYRREPLLSPFTLKSGEMVEVELEIESKNDYEYLVFEDMKPAGFEPVEVRSGYNGNAMNAYVEFRDERVVFFVGRLPRGQRSVSYRMRAEIPGSFSALPTRASAMYAPEIKANSDEAKASVQD